MWWNSILFFQGYLLNFKTTQAKFEGFGHFPEKAWKEWPEIWHADVSWPHSELIIFWSQSVFSSFWRRFNLVIKLKFVVSGLTHGENGLKLDMLMYLEQLQNCLDFGLGLFIFLVLWHFDLVKQVNFEVSGHFLETAWEELPEIWHADVSWPWPPSQLIVFRSWSLEFLYFLSSPLPGSMPIWLAFGGWGVPQLLDP